MIFRFQPLAASREGCHTYLVEASYRIIRQADGTFAVERTEPGREPVISGHFNTEAEARSHVADLKKMGPLTR